MKKLLLVLLVVLSGLAKVCPSTAQVANKQDSLVLVNFYDSTNGPHWDYLRNWLKGPVSTWWGVSLDDNGYVNSIQIVHEDSLRGNLPISLGSLSHLRLLMILNSRLTGSIPSSLGNLSNLNTLYLLDNSQLGGDIPASLGNLTNLSYLCLSNNHLTGEIPSSLGNLSNLSYLNLGGNGLSGQIPSSLGNLSKLGTLDLSGDNLSGEIPVALGNLSNLGYLNLSGNSFSGIPAALGNLSNLTYLDMSGDHLVGEIPVTFGNLSKLNYLDLQFNKLSGVIPATLGNLSELNTLRLKINQLSGEIPASLGNLSNLNELSLDGNNLSGEIPASLGNLSKLSYLALQYNNLSGEIPASLGNLSNLGFLILDDNQLSGGIPESLANLSKVEGIALQDNRLSGEIPESLGNLSSLTTLELDGNQLSGKIPASLGSLSNLYAITLQNNQLSGEIPASFSNLSKLSYLYLANNHLTGRLPSLINLSSGLDLTLNDNKFTFDGIEGFVNTFYNRSTSKEAYSPQDTILPIHMDKGVLSVSAGGSLANNTYKWTNNDTNADTLIRGDSTFSPISPGRYSVSIQNSIANQLTLNSNTIEVVVNYNFPPDNFKVSASGATCVGSNDGAIKIIADSSLPYTATVSNSSFNSSYSFHDSLAINNLSAGSYQICITVQGEAGYQQCYNLTITQPKPLSAYAVVNPSQRTITLNMDGGHIYYIQLGHHFYTTSNNAITLPLTSNEHQLMISTDKSCQGLVIKHLHIPGEVLSYPNPFRDYLNIDFGKSTVANAIIKITELSTGRVVYDERVENQSGTIQLNTSDFSAGVYALDIYFDNVKYTFKIVKVEK